MTSSTTSKSKSQSQPSSSDPLGSRRPARAALPPFTLPPPPEIPAAVTAATVTDALSPATGGVRSAGQSSSYSTHSSSTTGTLSSPGYSAAHMSSYGSPSPRQAHAQPSYYRVHGSPSQQTLAPRPGPPPPGGSSQMSPQASPAQSSHERRPSSGYDGEKLPSIASLIPHSPSRYPPHQSSSSPGHLARPAGIPLRAPGPGGVHHHVMPGPPLASPPFLRIPPPPNHHPGTGYGPGHYLEFTVGSYAVARESSQQDRPFKCDQCSQSFSRNHDLKRHKRIHLAAKPFSCPHCQKCFSRKDALKRHSLVKACGGGGGGGGGKKKDSTSKSDDSESSSPAPEGQTEDLQQSQAEAGSTAESDQKTVEEG
ncbi:hypothetical protein B0H66DRAFT_380136 [Apodospora peruviana]|uniref:C2H2-type domain-containing protein n=1 Tax=Apodospora peruviana TaxID=516989 RepID=A0AAE0LZM2_9PEZI|nr:hypothetical protein B0H66DRAFT_380136 [Apodospora peruviana]